MKVNKKNQITLVALLLMMYFLIIYFLLTNHLKWFDLPITTVIQSMESPAITAIMNFFTFIGSTKMVILIIAINAMILFFFKFRKEILFLILASAGSAMINVILKQLFKRERPSVHRLIDVTGYSFPSGHSMAAFTLYVVLAYLLWGHLKNRLQKATLFIVSFIFIIVIGYSRIYLGVHYPSDILAGYLTSFFWLFLCTRVCKRLL